MKEIRQEKYHIIYDETQATVSLEGALLLNGATAYEPILALLTQAAEAQEHASLTIDISGLNFLNSSGINMMTRFIMYLTEVKELQLDLSLRGQKEILWQERLAINLRRLMPELHTDLS
jgi:hypothetical protein